LSKIEFILLFQISDHFFRVDLCGEFRII
jgi:hypothetical protein